MRRQCRAPPSRNRRPGRREAAAGMGRSGGRRRDRLRWSKLYTFACFRSSHSNNEAAGGGPRRGRERRRRRVHARRPLQQLRRAPPEAAQVPDQLHLHDQVQHPHLPPQGHLRAVPPRRQPLLPPHRHPLAHPGVPLLRRQHDRAAGFCCWA